MMSIILQQMTAIHPGAARSYLTYPYLADLALSNANPSLFPQGKGIPPCAPTVYRAVGERDRDITGVKKKRIYGL